MTAFYVHVVLSTMPKRDIATEKELIIVIQMTL